MITPKLEELILCGKAFFKTAVVGGSKTTINIDNDRFAIITDITYLGYNNLSTGVAINTNVNTQLSIYGERGFNHYFFKNKLVGSGVFFDAATGPAQEAIIQAAPPQKIDCYILHTKQIGFSFIVDNTNFPGPISTLSIASYDNPGFPPPLDYGIDGQTGAVNIDRDITFNAPTPLLNQIVNRGFSGLSVGSDVTQQIQYQATTQQKPTVNGNYHFPIANINYVEILGQPNNIGI